MFAENLQAAVRPDRRRVHGDVLEDPEIPIYETVLHVEGAGLHIVGCSREFKAAESKTHSLT